MRQNGRCAHLVQEVRVDFTSETNGPVQRRFWETLPNAANADLDGFGVPSLSRKLQHTLVVGKLWSDILRTSLWHSNKPCNGHVTDSDLCPVLNFHIGTLLRAHRYVYGTLTGHRPQVADRDRQQTKARPLAVAAACAHTSHN